MKPIVLILSALLALTSVSFSAAATEAEDELRAVEVSFAQTMVDRNWDAFSGFLAEDVVFFDGDTKLIGRQAVSDAWRGYYTTEEPLFSWEPEAVAVLASGDLGFTSGPVFAPSGDRIGTFNSVWRKSGSGQWRIVFDRGCPACE